MRIRFRLYLERDVGVPNAGVTGIVPGLPLFD
mgnify:FL=1